LLSFLFFSFLFFSFLDLLKRKKREKREKKKKKEEEKSQLARSHQRKKKKRKKKKRKKKRRKETFFSRSEPRLAMLESAMSNLRGLSIVGLGSAEERRRRGKWREKNLRKSESKQQKFSQVKGGTILIGWI